MSRVRVAKLDNDEFARLFPEPKAVVFIRDNGYNPGLEEHWTALSVKDDENTTHIVSKGECLTKPLHLADAVKDSMTLWTCSCKDYRWNQMAGLDEGESPEQIGDCKHIRKVKKQTWSERDVEEGQETL